MSRFWVLGLALLVAALAIGIGSRQAVAVTPVYATKAFVLLAIQAFDQNVVQPIAARVTDLEGDAAALDQRVAALELGNQTPPIVTDRALVVEQYSPTSITHLIDTNDGSIVATFEGAIPLGSTCGGTRALLNNAYQGVTLIDGSTGQILAEYDAPPGQQLYKAAFGCHKVSALLSGQTLVKNRASIAYYGGGGGGSVDLIDTDSGEVVVSYVIPPPDYPADVQFSCLGDRFLIQQMGIFDSETGAELQDALEGVDNLFLCGSADGAW